MKELELAGCYGYDTELVESGDSASRLMAEVERQALEMRRRYRVLSETLFQFGDSLLDLKAQVKQLGQRWGEWVAANFPDMGKQLRDAVVIAKIRRQLAEIDETLLEKMKGWGTATMAEVCRGGVEFAQKFLMENVVPTQWTAKAVREEVRQFHGKPPKPPKPPKSTDSQLKAESAALEQKKAALIEEIEKLEQKKAALTEEIEKPEQKKIAQTKELNAAFAPSSAESIPHEPDEPTVITPPAVEFQPDDIVRIVKHPVAANCNRLGRFIRTEIEDNGFTAIEYAIVVTGEDTPYEFPVRVRFWQENLERVNLTPEELRQLNRTQELAAKYQQEIESVAYWRRKAQETEALFQMLKNDTLASAFAEEEEF